MIPYLKIKAYTDIYEKLCRIFTENLCEINTILSNASLLKNKLTIRYKVAEIYLKVDELIANNYLYPSGCEYHKEYNVNTHMEKCGFARFACANLNKNNKNENEKIGFRFDKTFTTKVKDFYMLFETYTLTEKIIYIEAFEVKINLNNELPFYEKFRTKNLISKTKEENNSKSLNKNLICTILKLPNKVTSYEFEITELTIEMIPSALYLVKNYYTRVFMNYYNTNIKLIDYDFNYGRYLNLKSNNLTMVMKSNLIEDQSCDLDIRFGLYINMKTNGNNFIGPSTDIKLFNLDIKDVKLYEYRINKSKQKIKLFSFELFKKIRLKFEMFTKVKTKKKLDDRYSYIYCTQENIEDNEEKNDNNYYNYNYYYDNQEIIDDDYHNYNEDEFINEEEHYFHPNYNNQSNKDKDNFFKDLDPNIKIPNNSDNINNNDLNDPNDDGKTNQIFKVDDFGLNRMKLKNPHSFSKYIRNKKYMDEMFIKGQYINNSESNRSKGKLTINLNIIRVFQVKKILEDIKDFEDNFSKHFNYFISDKTQYDKLKYVDSRGYNFDEIEIIVTNSIFGSKLFNITIRDIFIYLTNKPKKKDFNVIKSKMKSYPNFYSEQEKHKDIEKHPLVSKNSKIKLTSNINQNKTSRLSLKLTHIDDFYSNNNTFTLTDSNKLQIPKYTNFFISKFLIFIQYHNNNNTIFEPLIEPLPVRIDYFNNENAKFLSIDFFSLIQKNYGISYLCRQKNFHSLNININEAILDNVNSLNLDYESNKSKFLEAKFIEKKTESSQKKLIITNLTEYSIKILKQKKDLLIPQPKEEKTETDKKNQLIFFYDIRLNFRDSEYLIIQFANKDDEIKETDFDYLSDSNLPDDQGMNSVHNTKSYFNRRNLISEERKLTNETRINTEKTSKTFKIIIDPDLKNKTRYQNANLLINEEETRNKFLEMDKDIIRKNYDEKVSILLPGELLLVSEVELDILKNKKTVTLRSNEGIQNSLDFPLQIGFFYKEGYSFQSQSMSLVLNPGKIFYIPCSLIDKIVEIKFCPYLYTDPLKFNSKGYKIEKKSLEEDEISIIKCQIKDEDQVAYFDSIVFAVKKQYNLVETEYFDNNIKERLKIIKEYKKSKGKDNEFEYEKQKIHGLVCDIIYNVAPVFKFYNSLPRIISVVKKFPHEVVKKSTDFKNNSSGNNNQFYYLSESYVNIDGILL